MSVVIRILLVMVAAALPVASQTELNSKGEPVHRSVQNAPVELSKGEKITRGDDLVRGVSRVKIERALSDPAKFADKTVEVEGVIVRSCLKEGCWMEIADKEGGRSVRVTFGDHAFFIPLNSAGLKVRAQGVFRTKVLSKEHVDHLVNDDGAVFENRNPDGTVTETSFDAKGVVLTKP
ncbi:MAG TPA: DUF4920 domain-containing protein [Pyrinomonadaceae bacterium]|nr:DUF4920 domain-containing protein [Pyrinomonadaceae bacterium]HMP66333.1 DUF4920 domain-containing protein [Pyrinomonadaceae bacterium]